MLRRQRAHPWVSSVVGLLLWFLMASGCSNDADPVETARAHLGEGRVDDAIGVLRAAIAEDPDNASLNLSYGRVLLAAGQPSLAVWALAKAEKDPAYAVQAGMLLANAQMKLGSHDEAAAALEAVLALEPDNLEALRLKVESNLEARQPEVALETVEEALDLVPDDLGLLMSRMRILLTLDRGEEAGATLSEVRQRIQELEELPTEQRDFLAGRYCAVNAMFTHESGDSGTARSLFEQCLEDHPIHPQVIASALDFYDAIGEPGRATDVLRDALATSPKDLSKRVTLAMRLTRLGQPADAEALLRSVADEQPAVWAALVDYYVDIDDREKALAALDRALDEAGTSAPADWKLLRADLLIQSGRLDEAELGIDEIDEEVYAFTARGRLELARGNPDKALQLLENGIRLWPDGTMARYLAAQAAEQLGDFERAESEYREAYRSDQAYTDAGLKLAGLLAARGLPGDAAELAFAYTGANPADPRGWEAAISYALEARKAKMARSTLMHYQRHPLHRSAATAFAARYLLRIGRAEEALDLIDGSLLDLALVDNIETLRARCEVLISQKRFAEAHEQIDGLLRLFPDRTDLMSLKARTLESEGRVDEAREIYERILDQDPERIDALTGLATLESRSGRRENALELFDRVASIDPENSDALLSAAALSRSTNDKERRLREALRRNPRHARAAEALADMLDARGEEGSPEVSDLRNRASRFGRSMPSLVSEVEDDLGAAGAGADNLPNTAAP